VNLAPDGRQAKPSGTEAASTPHKLPNRQTQTSRGPPKRNYRLAEEKKLNETSENAEEASFSGEMEYSPARRAARFKKNAPGLMDGPERGGSSFRSGGFQPPKDGGKMPPLRWTDPKIDL
jgi:hypothetical protein